MSCERRRKNQVRMCTAPELTDIKVDWDEMMKRMGAFKEIELEEMKSSKHLYPEPQELLPDRMPEKA